MRRSAWHAARFGVTAILAVLVVLFGVAMVVLWRWRRQSSAQQQRRQWGNDGWRQLELAPLAAEEDGELDAELHGRSEEDDAMAVFGSVLVADVAAVADDSEGALGAGGAALDGEAVRVEAAEAPSEEPRET